MNVRQSRQVGIAAAVCLAGVIALIRAADVLKELGLTDASAKHAVLNSITDGYVPIYPSAKAIKAAAPAVRVTLVKGVLMFTRSYTESAEFAQAYLKWRESHKPSPPTPQPSADEELAKRIKDLERNIEDSKKTIANPKISEAGHRGAEQAIQTSTKRLEALKNDPKEKESIRQNIERRKAVDEDTYKRSLKEWEVDRPADPKVLLTKRLRKFLDISATVDYDAKVVKSGTKMRFADVKYERQPSDWKLCYRTGKEPVDAARAFATEWLAALGK